MQQRILSGRLLERIVGVPQPFAQAVHPPPVTIGFTDFSEEERAKLPSAPQVLVRVHPGSGCKTLYLASHAMRIHGMPVPEGRILLRDLMEHATLPQFVYTHRWQVGDMVMWDNRCTMHRAREYDARQVRELHRTTVMEEASTLAQAAP